MGPLILRKIGLRALSAIPILLAVTFGTYVMLFAIGDPASVVAGEGATPEQVEEVRQRLGLDRPIVLQYLAWLGNVLQGNLGESLHHKGAVTALLAQHMPPTLLLSLLALLLATVSAVAMGTAVGMRPDGLVDRGLRGLSLLGIAVPNFLVGLLLVLAFAIWLPWFPAGGYRTPAEVGVGPMLSYLVLPAIALGISLMCQQMRTFRASLVREYRADYVRTARMKGASERSVFFGHVSRNASGPLVTVIGLEIGVLITGALLVEAVFAIPGIGTLTLESVRGQDFPVVQGLVALFAAVVMAANLVADLVVLWLDPAARAKA
ncbi:peptide/nickel transport system permease protein [Spinactinospora alkalitolerans]|uniref:Peptide/nickel transport system permease protein n=1 Tax=Spinactinospora alkalitolerans TaxID=687207 RepID=A0A852TV74_9ACTN|nr:ABC transporter permease [Spinactinospora alkalitolerans]NYE47848.1 peptide/nickel transport system permease protein [Spinactinospora alkalitolerans]